MKCTVQLLELDGRGFRVVFPPFRQRLFVVPAAGFNKRARDFAFAKRNLKRIDGDELVELVYKYYPQLDAKYKAMIPLRSVYIPETLAE